MADTFNTRTLASYFASLPGSPASDATLVTQDLQSFSSANFVTADSLGSAAYQSVSYFALAASGALADSAVQSVTGVGVIAVNNTDPRNPIITFTGGSTGDVTGPASAIAGRFASFNGTTGKLIQDSGFSPASFATAAQGALAGTALQPAAIGTSVQGYSAVLAATTASFTTAKDTKLSGIATGATVNNTDAFLLARANHTGTQSADTLTDGTTNKAFLATERTKLTGIATGATANNTDAFLLARANHTGTQAASTVTGLSTVATTGAYGDLSSRPTLGALASKNTVTAGGDFSATGTASATTYLRGDNTWATPAGGGSGQVNTIVAGTGIAVNATDPVNPTVLLSTASQNSLGKADTALQPATIGVSVQGYDADLQSWGGVTRASGFDTFAATPTSANLRGLVTDETGTGSLVFGTIGTAAGNLVALDGSARLPGVDGSQLTNLPSINIAGLPSAPSFSSTLQFPVNNGGTTQKLTGQQIIDGTVGWKPIGSFTFPGGTSSAQFLNVPSGFGQLRLRCALVGTVGTGVIVIDVSPNNMTNVASIFAVNGISTTTGTNIIMNIFGNSAGYNQVVTDSATLVPGITPQLRSPLNGVNTIVVSAPLNAFRVSVNAGTFVAGSTFILEGM